MFPIMNTGYIPADEGRLYRAAHKDFFNSEIIGYSLESRITINLVKQSLLKAVRTRRPPAGLIHHSDRGIKYCGPKYRKFLRLLPVPPLRCFAADIEQLRQLCD
jgi:putative transposase